MTWKSVTTVSLACGCITYYRGKAAPKMGHIVLCPYCKTGVLVKALSVVQRTYPHEAPIPD